MRITKQIAVTLGLVFWTTFGWAETVKMTFGSNPPYIIGDSGKGIEIDIIREALALKGHKLEAVFVPVLRVEHELKIGKVDAASHGFNLDAEKLKLHPAEKTVTLSDYLFTDAKKNLNPKTPEDLESLRIIAFPNASKIYPKWLENAQKSGRYFEVSDQTQQLKMLYKGRADVVLADENIIKYLANQLSESSGEPKPELVKSAKLGDFSSFPVFKDAAIRDDYNEGLAELRASNRYQEIFDSYTK